MQVNLNSLSQNQLNDLISRAENRKGELKKETLVKVREKITTMIKAGGFTMDDVLGNPPKQPATKGKAKYRNPADPSQTWSGRGKHPKWFNTAIKAGKKEADLVV